jgi:hypothetical protein
MLHKKEEEEEEKKKKKLTNFLSQRKLIDMHHEGKF